MKSVSSSIIFQIKTLNEENLPTQKENE